ncbi:hypothetical protein LB456_06475 [Psychroflexus sp. CAK57W]|uniref:hypothetical protein n=1 Tax=Psychroflexus curvus TaxID=2873595 RepID=UPI001CCAF851|nr:hypothetical protein [Psychroflexus curvus]MBZ9627095.1 hypothetical protein [Psychroflexus curvus]MBZ9787101.1 hypothetical protein [Psychroflexus curvus]
MKPIGHIFFFLLLLTSTLSLSQDITVNQNAWGYEFKQGDQELTWKELLKETESDLESYDLIKRAQSQNTLSTIFAFAGGAFVGIPVGQTIGDGEPSWVLAIAGGALIAVAIPLSSRSKRNLEEGISQYNARTKSSFLRGFQPEVSLVGSATGVGLRVRF